MIYNTGGFFNTDTDGSPYEKSGKPSTLEYPYNSIVLKDTKLGVELFGYDDPAEPDYKGMLIFQDRNNPKSLEISAGASVELNGIVYIIKELAKDSEKSIVYNSNSTTGATGYTIFVIQSIEITGNGKFIMNSNYDDEGSPLLPRISLAE